MKNLPFRTNSTWLDDVDLVLLDALFDCGTLFRLLRSVVFRPQWNLGYSHDLTDEQLRTRLQNLVDRGVLTAEHPPRGTVLRMTPEGGELWSQERRPNWERFCNEGYSETRGGRELMSVVALSPEIRDDFLRLWPECPTRDSVRRRAASIHNAKNHELLNWKSFECYHVGLATCRVQREWTLKEYPEFRARYRDHLARLDEERTWWRCVSELQRFTPRDG
jgi:hypothetical protein